MQENNFYIHGSSPVEQDRLSRLNALLNEKYLDEIGPFNFRSILDLGAGLGHLTRLFRQRSLPGSRVVGIELDTNQLAQALLLTPTALNITYRQGNVQQLELPEAEWGSFDFVHARFVLEHVPGPQQVVNLMAKAAAINGVVAIADDDHEDLKLYPEIDGFERLWKAYIQSYLNNHNDPYIGRKQVSLLVNTGLKPLRNGFSFFGACRGMEEFDGFVENLIGIIEGARGPILQTSMVSDTEIDKVFHRIRTWSHREDASIWYPVYYALGLKKG